MNRRYFYIAQTYSGGQHEFFVESNNEDTANAEAKMEVERWLREEDESPDRLAEFALTHTTP